jgi:anti-sigma factor (TIGR02949 family)
LLTCKEFLQELNDYLDPDVAEDVKQRLRKHVNECPNCFVIVDTTQKTMQVYRGMEPQKVPSDVQSRLMEALQRKMAARRQGTS